MKNNKINVKAITVCAVSIALVLVATMFINIRLPFMGNGGLIHLGNVPLFLVAIIFGKKVGFIAGSFGMGLFDLLSGWTVWAPFTFIICGLIGYFVGAICENKNERPVFWQLLGILGASIIKIVGYYFAEVIIYGNWILPFGSIPGNVMQMLVAGLIVLPVATYLKNAFAKANIINIGEEKCTI